MISTDLHRGTNAKYALAQDSRLSSDYKTQYGAGFFFLKRKLNLRLLG